MPPTIDFLRCDCPNCNAARVRRMREDLNAMYEKRITNDPEVDRIDIYRRQPDGFWHLESTPVDNGTQEALDSIRSTDLEFLDDQYKGPSWKVFIMAAACWLLFFACVYYGCKEIGRMAGIE